MAVIMKGSEVVAAMKEKMILQIAELRQKGIEPHLGVIRIGNRADDIAYERSAVKRCEGLGIGCNIFEFPSNISNADFISEFSRINNASAIHGILLLRPVPPQINEDEVKYLIDPVKDIDCMSHVNIAKVFEGDDTGFAPCTPEAVIEVLDHYNIQIKGKQVVIVGRSMVVGKPLSMLLLKKHATVTICHTRTINIEEICKRAEILVAAAGKANMIGPVFISEGCIIIDVGINVDKDGKLCGDVDYDAVSMKASMITPVPGGVGTVTTSVLAKHVIKAAFQEAFQ